MKNSRLFFVKLNWYAKNIWNLFVALIRIFFYCLINRKKFRKLMFSFYATINEFYQLTHGELNNFNQTRLARKLQKESVLSARCNYFQLDVKVMRPVETQILANLTAYLRPKTVFEIGTYNGFSTLHFAYNTSEDAVIYTMDLPPDYKLEQQNNGGGKYSYDDWLVVELSQENINNRLYKKTEYKGKINEIFANSREFDFTPYHGKIDLIFIDGNHSYDFVQSDTDNAFKMLSDDGIIIWHDYDYIIHRDVFKYLNQLYREKEIYYIPRTRFAIYGKKVH